MHTGLGMQGLGDRGCGIIWTPGGVGEHRERVGGAGTGSLKESTGSQNRESQTPHYRLN